MSSLLRASDVLKMLDKLTRGGSGGTYRVLEDKGVSCKLEGVMTYYNALVRGAKWSFIVSNMQRTTYTVCKIDTLGRQGGKSDSDGNKLIIKQTGKSVDEAKRLDLLAVSHSDYSYIDDYFYVALFLDLSTNHGVARGARHKGMTVRSSSVVSPCEFLTR